jgi:hypothetical protein
VELVTVHSVTLPTFQNTFVVPPLRTSCGRTWRWPLLLRDCMNVIGGRRQIDDPAEQKLGASHVARLLVLHWGDRYTIVSPLQV